MTNRKGPLPEGASFRFKMGARVPAGVKPAIVAKELERIRYETGGVRPDDVIERARPVSSPIHDAFNWDDSVAAHEFRLIQARTLIRAVVVVYPDTKKPRTMYVHIQEPTKDDDGVESSAGVYQPMRLVVQDVDMFTIAKGELLSKLESSERSYEELLAVAKEFSVSKQREKQAKAVGGHLGKAVKAAKKIR